MSGIRPGDRVTLRGRVTGIYDFSSALVELDDRRGYAEVPLAALEPDPEQVNLRGTVTGTITASDLGTVWCYVEAGSRLLGLPPEALEPEPA